MNSKNKHLKHIQDWASVEMRGKYKTAIQTEKENQYNLVTRVNHHTSMLWKEWREDKIKNITGFVHINTGNCWLLMIKSFKRSQEKLIEQNKG